MLWTHNLNNNIMSNRSVPFDQSKKNLSHKQKKIEKILQNKKDQKEQKKTNYDAHKNIPIEIITGQKNPPISDSQVEKKRPKSVKKLNYMKKYDNKHLNEDLFSAFVLDENIKDDARCNINYSSVPSQKP